MLEKLGIDWNLFLFQIANFLILLFVLNKVLYKPVFNFLDARRKKIEEGLEKCEKFGEEWQKIKNIEKEKMEEAEKAAYKIVEKARVDAQIKEKEILELARQKAEKIIEEAKTDILREREKILEELKGETTDFIVFATEKILKRTIKDEDEKKMIKEALEAFEINEK